MTDLNLLQAKLAGLAQQLREAQELVDAIIDGDVDSDLWDAEQRLDEVSADVREVEDMIDDLADAELERQERAREDGLV